MWVKVRYEEIIHETERALCLLCGAREVWLPKSRLIIKNDMTIKAHIDFAREQGLVFDFPKSHKRPRSIPAGIPLELLDD